MVRAVEKVTAHPTTFEIICKACQLAKPRERFKAYPKGGYEPTCRDCQNDRLRERRRIYMVDYRKQNPDYVRAANQSRDPEKTREQSRRWRAGNSERAKASQARYRAEHRDELREYQREYRRLRLSTSGDSPGDDASPA